MRKKEGIHWTKLERDEHTVDLKPAGSLESSGTSYMCIYTSHALIIGLEPHINH